MSLKYIFGLIIVSGDASKTIVVLFVDQLKLYMATSLCHSLVLFVLRSAFLTNAVAIMIALKASTCRATWKLPRRDAVQVSDTTGDPHGINACHQKNKNALINRTVVKRTHLMLSFLKH